MVKTLILATVVAGLAAASVAYTPKCRADGDRCKGASGYPIVDWIPCCDGYECTAEDTSYGGYGTLCAPVKKYYTEPPAPKCRAEGDRCKGASGYPTVDWIPCCDGYECTAEDTSYDGYGTLCAPVKKYYTEPPAPKCRAEGDRCIGASGYPKVDWIPCCDGYECSADDKRDDGYGKLCAPKMVYTTAPPVYTTKAPVYTTAPPVYTTAPPVYTTETPVYTTAEPVYTTALPVYTTAPPVYTTVPPVYTTAPPVYSTAPPKCVKESDECSIYGMMCCKGLECVESGKYDYSSSCEPIMYTTTTTTTTTTTPKCLETGEKCDEYKPCCDYAQCVKDDYGDASTCVAY